MIGEAPKASVLVLQPPSPPFTDIDREFSAGLGLSSEVSRSTWGHTGGPFFNHDLAWSAGCLLDAGHEVRLVDAQAERMSDADVIGCAEALAPSLIIMQVNLPSLDADLELAGRLAEHVPQATMVCVGTVNRLLKERVASSRGVDYVVHGEAASIVPQLVEVISGGGDPACVPGIAFIHDGDLVDTGEATFADLDAIARTPYHMLPMERYVGKYFAPGKPVAGIVSSKGCPYPCAYYCPYPVAFGTRVRFRSPANVADEVEFLRTEYGVRHFILRDQNFTINAEHARHLCEEFIARDLDIEWVCETRLMLARDPQLLDLMKSAGCSQINFGLETGDPAQFEAVGKPGTEFGLIKAAVEMTQAAGLRAHGHAVIGLPGESWGTIRNTARLLRRCQFDSVNFSFMVPVPGTRFFEDAMASGHVLSDDLAHYGHSSKVVRTEHMTGFELRLASLLLSNVFVEFRLHRSIPARCARWLSRVFAKRRRQRALRGLEELT